MDSKFCRGAKLLACFNAFLLISLLSSPAVFAASCTRHIHNLAEQYNFGDGNMWFDYLDMDAQERGISRNVKVLPGDKVTVFLGWTWGTTCPSCRVNVNAIGDWAPREEIARPFSGVKGDVSQSYDYSFSFDAPDLPGEYRLRVFFNYGDEFVSDFDASNLCTDKQCRGQGECHVLFAEGVINVTTDITTLNEVEITSPTSTSISEKVRIDAGETVRINARVDDPSASIAVKVDGAQVSGILPYDWDTSEVQVGEHSIEVVATDGAGNVVSQEITVTIFNASESIGDQPPLFWSYEGGGAISDIEISSKGQDTATATGDGEVYLFDMRGGRTPVYQASGALKDFSMSSKGDYLAVGEGSEVYVLKEGSRVWNYSAGQEISVVDIASRGDIIAVGAGNTVHVVNIGNLEWTYDLQSAVTDIVLNAVGDYVAVSSGDGVFLLRNGSQVWNYTGEGPPGRISITSIGDAVLAAFGNELHLIKGGEAVWNRSIGDAIIGVSLTSSGDRIAFASARDIYYLDKDGSTIWKYQKEGGLGGIALSSNGEYLACYKDSTLSFFATKPGLEEVPLPTSLPIVGGRDIGALFDTTKSILIRTVLIIALLLAAFFLMKRVKAVTLPGLPGARVSLPGREGAKPSEGPEGPTGRIFRIKVVNSLRGTPVRDASVSISGRNATRRRRVPGPEKGQAHDIGQGRPLQAPYPGNNRVWRIRGVPGTKIRAERTPQPGPGRQARKHLGHPFEGFRRGLVLRHLHTKLLPERRRADSRFRGRRGLRLPDNTRF